MNSLFIYYTCHGFAARISSEENTDFLFCVAYALKFFFVYMRV